MAVLENVVLANGGAPITIRPDHVYFAFPSGRFAYDCVACEAKCCHGHGFEVLVGRELQSQLATSHAVRFFLDPCEAGAADHYHARNLKPGCFFLDARNFCGIQVKHGYDSKPETCRLFPFNQINRFGDYLIVAPHSGLCPLAILPPGERSDASSHEQLLSMMGAMGIGTHVTDVTADGIGAPALVALEKSIVELSDRDPHVTRYAENVAAQVALTRLSGGSTDPADVVQTRAHEDVERFFRLLYEVLGADRPAEDDADQALVCTMVGMTPSIQSRFIFGEGAIAEPGIERIPYSLLALHTLAAFASEAGMAKVTYQSVMGLFDNFRPLLRLLTNLDRVMVWKAGATIDFAVTGNKALQARYIDVAKALLPGAQRTAGATLGRILCDHLVHEEMDRVVFLKLLARRLEGRLVPMTGPPAAGRRLRRPRAAAQQWAMRHLSPDVLMLIADRQFRRATGK